MKTITVGKQKLYALRSLRCSLSDKFNRVYKLAATHKQLIDKLETFIDTQTVTQRSQCALAIKLCLHTGMRIGSEESAVGLRSKKGVCTFGITTMQKQFITFRDSEVVFSFVGKKGVYQCLTVTDKCLIEQLRRQSESVAGETLFTVTDAVVRKFVKRSIGRGYCVKDFRTLVANLYATEVIKPLLKTPKPPKKSVLNAEIKGILSAVSSRLGNTPGICKRAYIDPLLLGFYAEMRGFAQRV